MDQGFVKRVSPPMLGRGIDMGTVWSKRNGKPGAMLASGGYAYISLRRSRKSRPSSPALTAAQAGASVTIASYSLC